MKHVRILVSILCAWVCARFAPSRASRHVLWFFIIGEVMGIAATIPNRSNITGADTSTNMMSMKRLSTLYRKRSDGARFICLDLMTGRLTVSVYE